MTGLERIRGVVREVSGIASETLGRNAIERAVRRRVAELHLQCPEEYERVLERSAVERQTFLESLVVPETWFFRDAEAFAVLAKHALELQRSSRVLRILSIPCSTGEEPYSIAMALLDTGMPRGFFTVDAVDISGKEIAWAQQAVYGRNSFRGDNQFFRERYFSKVSDGYQLRADVRECVRFEQANLLAAEFFQERQRYDVIFCRNLLIYFDSEMQGRAIRTLSRLLAEDGVLLSGPSEAPLFLFHGFESARIPRAFAFRRCRQPQAPRQGSVVPPVAARVRLVRAVPKPLAPVVRQTAVAVTAQAEGVSQEDALEKAERLADSGALSEAVQLCEQYIREHGASARAFYLLGLVKDGASDPQGARECYRKAVYLEPDHYQSLIQLALLAEQDGNLASATAFRERARRVSERSTNEWRAV